jgi:hypothetical protein
MSEAGLATTRRASQTGFLFNQACEVNLTSVAPRASIWLSSLVDEGFLFNLLILQISAYSTHSMKASKKLRL